MNKWLVNILMLHVEMLPLAYKGRSMPPYFLYYNLVHFGVGFTQKHRIVSCVLHKRSDIDQIILNGNLSYTCIWWNTFTSYMQVKLRQHAR